jgi:hypothetical protein
LTSEYQLAFATNTSSINVVVFSTNPVEGKSVLLHYSPPCRTVVLLLSIMEACLFLLQFLEEDNLLAGF